MEIAVVGGGPGGSWAAILLAKRGHSVTLFDPQAPWEKPCGGGVTSRALERFEIFSGDLPRKKIEEITVFFGDRNSVKVVPQRLRCVGSVAKGHFAVRSEVIWRCRFTSVFWLKPVPTLPAKISSLPR